MDQAPGLPYGGSINNAQLAETLSQSIVTLLVKSLLCVIKWQPRHSTLVILLISACISAQINLVGGIWNKLNPWSTTDLGRCHSPAFSISTELAVSHTPASPHTEHLVNQIHSKFSIKALHDGNQMSGGHWSHFMWSQCTLSSLLCGNQTLGFKMFISFLPASVLVCPSKVYQMDQFRTS